MRAVCLLSALSLFAACDPVAHPDYQGDPVLRVRGQMVDAAGEPAPPPLDGRASMWWFDVSVDAPRAFDWVNEDVSGEIGFDVPPPADDSDYVFSVLGPPIPGFLEPRPASEAQDALAFVTQLESDGSLGDEPPGLSEFTNAHAEHVVAYNAGDGVLAELGFPPGLTLVRASDRAEVDPTTVSLDLELSDELSASFDMAGLVDGWLRP
jgi:hypothetical protein